MTVAEADLDAFIRTCQQQADSGSGISPRTYDRDTWRQLYEAEQERQAVEWTRSVAGQRIDCLEREVAQLRRELVRLRIETLGGTIKQARAAGYKPPPGVSDGAAVAGIPTMLLDTMAEALGEMRAELEQRISALEGRPTLAYRGLWQEGTRYAVDDAVAYSGSLWVARTAGLLERPSLDPDGSWQLAVKRGSPGRDLRDRDVTK